MIHGRNLIVALDGVAIAGAKSCKFNASQDFIKACSPTSGRVNKKIPTTYDWGVSCDCLIPSSNLPTDLTDKLIAGTRCLLTFTDKSGQFRAGWVYVKNCDQGGTVGSLATFSASFESDGALYKYLYNETFTEGEKTIMRINNGWSIVYNETFTEGEKTIMRINNDSIQLGRSLTNNVYGVQISGISKVTLVANGVVAITNAPFNAAMKAQFEMSDPPIINNNLVFAAVVGQNETTVTLDSTKTYTILSNGRCLILY